MKLIEVSGFSNSRIDNVIYSYLYENANYYDLDKEFLETEYIKYSFGGLSRQILDDLGLDKSYKGIFLNISEKEAINRLRLLGCEIFKDITKSIKRCKEYRGLFYGWGISNENVVYKNVNEYVLENEGIGISKYLETFWKTKTLRNKDEKSIKFIYNDKEYHVEFITECIHYHEYEYFIYFGYELQEDIKESLLNYGELKEVFNNFLITMYLFMLI